MNFETINKTRSSCAKLIGLGVGLVAIGFLVVYLLQTPVGFVAIIGGAIASGTGYVKFSKLNSEFKNTFLKKMIEEIFTGATYNPKGGIDQNRVYACNFLKRADRFHTEDLITGSFEDVHFETCDLKLEERHVRQTKNGTQVYYVTYFLGRFFEFAFPKQFKGQIIVNEGSLFTWFTGLKKIELESVEFNKKFSTYTTDDHNAFYVLTPHLMEALLTLEKNNPGKISISFLGNKLNIAINNSRNTFEMSLFKKVDESILGELKRDLMVIKDIINELKLNRNIFTY